MARKIKMVVETGFAGCEHHGEMDLPDGWDKMNEKEQEAFLEEVARDHLSNTISYAAWVEE